MRRNVLFGELLTEGLKTVEARQHSKMGAVVREVAAKLNYSETHIANLRNGKVPALTHVEQLARYCVRQGYVGEPWAKHFLAQAHHPDPQSVLDELFAGTQTSPPHLFISYQRGLQPDDLVALEVARALSREATIFFYQAEGVSEAWVETVQMELAAADFAVFLLSAESLYNEVVQLEIETAYRHFRHKGTPHLLPIWLETGQTFVGELPVALAQLNWAIWEAPTSTPLVIQQLQAALAGTPLPHSPRAAVQGYRRNFARSFTLPSYLEAPSAIPDLHSSSYIQRVADHLAHTALRQPHITITIKGSRQMGKSSLLLQLQAAAKRIGKTFVLLRPRRWLENGADSFFRRFAVAMSRALAHSDETQQHWSDPYLTHTARCTDYVEFELLPHCEQTVVLALDDADVIFDTPFRNMFFGMLREWHEYRAFRPIWKKLNLIVVTSTEPYSFIDDLNQSPFNVGERIVLSDFSAEQVAELNQRHAEPFSVAELRALMALIGGHPYLIRRAFYWKLVYAADADDIIAHAISDSGPFADHLRSVMWRLCANTTLRRALQEIITQQRCSDEQAFFRLAGAGVVRREGRDVRLHRQLYRDYFQTYFG